MRFRVLFILHFLMVMMVDAFGKNGHRAIAEIAQQGLSPKALSRVKHLLDGKDVWMVANWADDMRSLPEYKQADFWHWVDWNGQEEFKKRPATPMKNIIEKIREFWEKLDSGSYKDPKSEAEALRWLIHLIGDVHQPLHVGRSEDQGGNKKIVKYFGKETNLHSVWDDHLVEGIQLSFRDLAVESQFFCEKQTVAGVDSVFDWADESFELLDQVYDVGNSELEYMYVFHSAPILKRRICEAGLRLGLVMESIYGK
ncbi:MAG: S1/P1 nuclease [Candidatus Cloacimonetes bacterium]|nr:S1/P1 nuclease [Candidatus Cloacimonadota bacterium]